MNLTGLPGAAHLHPQLNEPLAHAYLLSGPEADSCRNLALTMARSLVCRGPGERPCNVCPPCIKAQKGIHPDILVTKPGEAGAREEVLVSQIREITASLHILPNEAEGKVYLIEGASTMNASAQNAFLKALEEPPPFVTFLLLAENPDTLLPTVRSRTAHLSLIPTQGESRNDDGPHQELVREFLEFFIAGDTLPLLEFCMNLENVDKNILDDFIENTYLQLIEALKKPSPDSPRFMAALELFDSLRTDIRFNVSRGHIAGKIAATLL